METENKITAAEAGKITAEALTKIIDIQRDSVYASIKAKSGEGFTDVEVSFTNQIVPALMSELVDAGFTVKTSEGKAFKHLSAMTHTPKTPPFYYTISWHLA